MDKHSMANPFSDIVHKHFAEGSLIPLNGLEFVIRENLNGEIHLVCRGMTGKMQKKMAARVDKKIKQKQFEFKFPENSVSQKPVTQQPVKKKSLLGNLFQRKTGE